MQLDNKFEKLEYYEIEELSSEKWKWAYSKQKRGGGTKCATEKLAFCKLWEIFGYDLV